MSCCKPFTPQVLLSAPRRSAGVPNPSGTTILFSTSSYSFEHHSQRSSLQALIVETGETIEIAANQDISDINWLDDERFFCLRSQKDGRTSLLFANLGAVLQAKGEVWSSTVFQLVETIGAPASDMKVARISRDCDDFAVALIAPACRSGELYTAEIAVRKTYSTGRLYDGLFVRHWDRYKGPEINALWYGRLSVDSEGQYRLSELTNLFVDTSTELLSLRFGGTSQFDIRKDAIIWAAKDPDLNPSLNTKCKVYIQHIESWTPERSVAKPKAKQINVEGFDGAAVSPVFAPVGNQAAFLKMRKNKYEADKNQIIVVTDVTASRIETTRVFSSSEKSQYEGCWDLSPLSVRFTADGESLIVTADDAGYGRVFFVSGEEIKGAYQDPRPLTQTGTATDVRCLADGRVYVNGTSFIDDSWYAIIDPWAWKPDSYPITQWSHSSSNQGDKFGLKASQISCIWTPASNPGDITPRQQIHSWVIKPSNFDSTKSYPVAYLFHGGPHASWKDSWSTRWNPAVFAEQGYIVVAPNPTGSTGYGQLFTDSSFADWGGSPYQDIVNVFEWVGQNLKGADNDRAVALGHSYGGYMINWIQGQDLGRKFKALVSHNGIFSSTGMLSTEELHFHFYEMDGPSWNPEFIPALPLREATRRQWDPSAHILKWKTPELVIHSEKDFRVTMAEGMALFNMLQARGVPSQFLIFPDENHWVVKPENSLVWHKTVLNWINKYVGLPPFSKEDPKDEDYWGGLVDDAGRSEVDVSKFSVQRHVGKESE